MCGGADLGRARALQTIGENDEVKDPPEGPEAAWSGADLGSTASDTLVVPSFRKVSGFPTAKINTFMHLFLPIDADPWRASRILEACRSFAVCFCPKAKISEREQPPGLDVVILDSAAGLALINYFERIGLGPKV